MLSINSLKNKLQYKSWMVALKYHLVSFSILMKPGVDLTVMYKLSSGNDESNDSEGIIIFFLCNFSKEYNQWSTF